MGNHLGEYLRKTLTLVEPEAQCKVRMDLFLPHMGLLLSSYC